MFAFLKPCQLGSVRVLRISVLWLHAMASNFCGQAPGGLECLKKINEESVLNQSKILEIQASFETHSEIFFQTSSHILPANMPKRLQSHPQIHQKNRR